MTNQWARTAGVLYAVVVVTGLFSLAYVPSQLVVAGDPTATLAAIASSVGLYRLGAVAYAVCYAAFLVLPLALYALLRSVEERAAVLMVAFATVSVPISFITLTHQFDVLRLVGEGAGGPGADLLDAQAAAALGAYGSGVLVSKVFWGLWLLSFGYLVVASGRLPKALGAFLIAGGLGYLADFVGRSLVPGFAGTAVAEVVLLPASVGEIGICLWLLVFGVREVPRPDPLHGALDLTPVAPPFPPPLR